MDPENYHLSVVTLLLVTILQVFLKGEITFLSFLHACRLRDYHRHMKDMTVNEEVRKRSELNTEIRKLNFDLVFQKNEFFAFSLLFYLFHKFKICHLSFGHLLKDTKKVCV